MNLASFILAVGQQARAEAEAISARHDIAKIKATRQLMIESGKALQLEGIDFDELSDEDLAQSAPHAKTKANWEQFMQTLAILAAFNAQEFPGFAGRPNDPRALAITTSFKYAIPVPLFVCLVRHTNLLPQVESNAGTSFSSWHTADGKAYSREDVLQLRAAAEKDICDVCRGAQNVSLEELMQIAKNLPRAQYVSRAVASKAISATMNKESETK